MGADLLKSAGVPPDVVQMVPSRAMDRDRTYGSAVALRDWFRSHNMAVHSVNVVTENAHARRTRFLFEKALGKDVAVGIIAVANPDYDEGRWWLVQRRRQRRRKRSPRLYLCAPVLSSFGTAAGRESSLSLGGKQQTMKVAIVGLGYVGLPLAMQFARYQGSW